MAGNTRGRLKELLESVHRDCEWQKRHCAEAVVLIANKNPKLKEAFEAIGALSVQLDEFAMSIYAGI